MTYKTFIIGLLATFGLPWLLAIAIPFAEMQSLDPVKYNEKADGQSGIYVSKRAGQIAQGSEIYGEEGCYYCHTQLIRPTYAGNDLWRADWAGLRKSADNPDTRRETNQFDFYHEKIAHIGLIRVGPDLSNFGRRVQSYVKADPEFTPEEWVYIHLYNPRGKRNPLTGKRGLYLNSVCPSKSGLFKEVNNVNASGDALPVAAPEGKAIVPTARAKTLVSYLLSLQKDNLANTVPASMDHAVSEPTKPE